MLTDTDLAILDLERQWFRHAGSKANEIAALGLSETRYYQLLVALIRKPEAMAEDPLTVKRLQRLQESRRTRRTSTRVRA